MLFITSQPITCKSNPTVQPCFDLTIAAAVMFEVQRRVLNVRVEMIMIEMSKVQEMQLQEMFYARGGELA